MEIDNKSDAELKSALQSLRESIDKEESPSEKAKLYVTLGNTYLLLSEWENQKDNLLSALVSFDDAANLMRNPEILEIVENMKGFVFFKLAFIEDRDENLRKSIEHYKNSLKFRVKDKNPYKYASTKYNLGNAFLSLRDGNDRENIMQAIEEFQKAYEVRKEQPNSVEFGVITNAMGLSYLMLSEIAGDARESAAFLVKAVSYFDAASRIFTLDKHPVDYAMIHNNIGVCFTKLAMLGVEKEKNLSEGIRHYKDALNVYTREDFLEDYGTTLYNMGVAYHNLSKIVPMPGKSEYLKEAEKYLRESADTFDSDLYIDAFARGKYNLGVVYKDLAALYKNDDFLSKELFAFTDALKGFSESKQPFAFATTHFYIAQVLYTTKGAEEALVHYKEARRVAEKFDKKLAEDLDKIINQIESIK